MSTDTSYSPPTPQTLRDLLCTSSSPALLTFSTSTSPPTPLSHTALQDHIATFSQSLLHLPAQSTISIVLPNSPAFIIAFLATTQTAHIAAPLNPAYTQDEFIFYLSDSKTHSVILPASLPPTSPIHKAATSLQLPIIPIPETLSLPPTPPHLSTLPSHLPSPDTIALFLHTSGTTSRPKGVPLTHANLCRSIQNICTTYQLTPSDRNLLVMPLFHVHGLMAATLSTLASKGCILIPPGGKFSASSFWPCLTQGQATWYTAVPTIHQILLNRAQQDYIDSHRLRFIRSCSASLAPAVLQEVETKFGTVVLEAYAMTEAAHQMTSNPLPKHGDRKMGSVGKAQGVQVTILNERNEQVGLGTVGEVCIRGANVTKGYMNNEEANAQAFAGGWFHTGDQGTMDEEGYLRLTGRIKELINRGGEKISPLEVDNALLGYDGVKEAVSFAVADEKYGEEVNAAIIWKQGQGGDVQALQEWLGSRLASFKVPKRVFVCDELPRTATGKIQRRMVAKHFAS